MGMGGDVEEWGEATGTVTDAVLRPAGVGGTVVGIEGLGGLWNGEASEGEEEGKGVEVHFY